MSVVGARWESRSPEQTGGQLQSSKAQSLEKREVPPGGGESGVITRVQEKWAFLRIKSKTKSSLSSEDLVLPFCLRSVFLNCIRRHIFILTDKCGSRPSSKKRLLQRMKAICYRKPQLVILQRPTDYGVLSPNRHIYSTAPASMAPGTSWKMGWEGRTSQRTRSMMSGMRFLSLRTISKLHP